MEELRMISKYGRGQIWFMYDDSVEKRNPDNILCGSRPVLIIQYMYEPGYSRKCTVLPVTHASSAKSKDAVARFYMYPLVDRDGTSYVDCNQPMTIPTSRLGKYVGCINNIHFQNVMQLMWKYLLDEEPPKTTEYLQKLESTRRPVLADPQDNQTQVAETTIVDAPEVTPTSEENNVIKSFKEMIATLEFPNSYKRVSDKAIIESITRQEFSDSFIDVPEYNASLKRAPQISPIRNMDDGHTFINGMAASKFYGLSIAAINFSARNLSNTRVGVFERLIVKDSL